MTGTFARRLAKLEANIGEDSIRSRRMISCIVISCIVRNGQQEEDRAEAFKAAGIEPTDRDFLILRIILSPDAADRMQDILPSAMLLAPLKTIGRNQNGR